MGRPKICTAECWMPCVAASKAQKLRPFLSSGLPPEIIPPNCQARQKSSGGVKMQLISRRFLLSAFLLLIAPLALFAQGWQHIGSVQKVEKLPDGVELTA